MVQNYAEHRFYTHIALVEVQQKPLACRRVQALRVCRVVDRPHQRPRFARPLAQQWECLRASQRFFERLEKLRSVTIDHGSYLRLRERRKNSRKAAPSKMACAPNAIPSHGDGPLWTTVTSPGGTGEPAALVGRAAMSARD